MDIKKECIWYQVPLTLCSCHFFLPIYFFGFILFTIFVRTIHAKTICIETTEHIFR